MKEFKIDEKMFQRLVEYGEKAKKQIEALKDRRKTRLEEILSRLDEKESK